MKKIVSALLFCALLLSLAACSQKSPTAQETEPESSAARTVTDSFGREVTIPAEVKAIVCTGSGALRMVTYPQCTDRLVGVEDCDKEYADSTLRDYAYVYHDTFDALPSIGKGGGTANTAYVEELIRLQPDVILSGYTQEALEDLAQSTGIPCVSIRAKSINFIDDSFYTAMRVAAEVLGVQERCEEVLQYIDGCKADLDARTADIPDEGKPAVYAGAVTFSGAHGFTGTYSNFGPLMAIHANNVADEMGETGYFDADPEQVVAWDPELIFLDPGNMSLVRDEYQTNPGFFDSLTAVREGNLYACVSFNNYSTNVGYALADAYYAGSVIYPERFDDVNIAEKADDILEFLLGRRYYNDMKANGLTFGVIELGSAQ